MPMQNAATITIKTVMKVEMPPAVLTGSSLVSDSVEAGAGSSLAELRRGNGTGDCMACLTLGAGTGWAGG